MELTHGHVQTDLGLLPKEWTIKPLRELSAISSGGTPRRDRAEYWNGSIPWVTTKEIDFGQITKASQFISKDGLANSAAKLFPAGTLLLALYGQGKTRGKVGVLGMPAATNQACASISVGDGVDAGYLLHFLASQYEAIRALSNGGSQDNLNGSIVKGILVPCPTLAEQRAIAAALSDVDALLAKLDQLIAKKRDLKQAAMQQLLTGQTRLPGFSGEWAACRLADICLMKSGEGITSIDIDDHSRFPCYGGNGIRGFTARYTHDGTYALVGRQGALCGNVLLVSGKLFASEHAVVITAKPQTDIRWLTVVLESMKLNQYSESSAQPGLSVAKLLELGCKVPDVQEQTAIATILSDIDAELTAMAARRDKTRALKQGMMQALLTGRIRLV